MARSAVGSARSTSGRVNLADRKQRKRMVADRHDRRCEIEKLLIVESRDQCRTDMGFGGL